MKLCIKTDLNIKDLRFKTSMGLFSGLYSDFGFTVSRKSIV